MKSLTTFYFLIIIQLTNCIFAQNSQDSVKQAKYFLLSTNYFHFAGDYVTHSIGIPLIIELPLNKDYNYSQSFVYIFTHNGYETSLVDPLIGVDKIHGFRLDGEIKKYFKKNILSKGFYISLHTMYQYTESEDFNWRKNLVFRNTFATHGKFGWQKIFKNGCVFDIAIGNGTRYVTAKSNYIGYSYETEFNYFYWYNKQYNKGSKWFYSFNGSFNVGWKINYKKEKQ